MNLKVHEQIIRDALDNGNTMSSQALGWVITANKLSDLHQFAPERHFDNAPNREMICERWRQGLKVFMDRAIELSAPTGEARRGERLRTAKVHLKHSGLPLMPLQTSTLIRTGSSLA